MQFKEVVAQTELKGKFTSLIQNNHLPHAILLNAAEGCGGLPFARAAVQYLMCENKSELDSCGECASCNKVSKLQHPDVHFSFPFNKEGEKRTICNDFYPDFRKFILDHPYATDTEWFDSQGKAGQGNIPAAECRDILRKLQMRPYENGYKIMIIWRPEYLGKEGNILLKFIEEPTPKTILFLVSEEPDKILPTILSRAQLFPLKRLTHEDIAKEIAKDNLTESQAIQIARLADGNYRKAQLLLGQSVRNFTELMSRWLDAIFNNQGLIMFDIAMDMASESKEMQKSILNYIIQLLEHCLRYQQLGSGHLALLHDEQSLIQKLIANGITIHRIEQISSIVNEAIYYIERNANSKILFHSLSLRVQQVFLAKKMATA